jgi:hypothetical protein
VPKSSNLHDLSLNKSNAIIFFIKNHKDIKYGLKIILKYVGFCWHSVFCSI